MSVPQEPLMAIGDLVRAMRGRLLAGEHKAWISGISIDSRTLRPGDLFLALRGERFDGHDFFPAALAQGAAALVGRPGSLSPPPMGWTESVALIEAEDPLYALGEIARNWRRRHDLPVLAVTGSNGKTTTKEMLAAILSQGAQLLKTEGNLNNRIGLPLMLMRLRPHHRAAILEMGMSEPGEIRRLCEIAQPQFGLITQVAPAHLEGLGSLEGVARAKGELFEALDEGGTAVVNLDDPWIARLARSCRAQKVTFGEADAAQVRGVRMEPFHPSGARMVLRIHGEERPVRMRCLGRPCVQNGLAAAAGAWAMRASMDEVARGLEAFRPFPMRLNVIPLDRGIHLIDDAYNANPESMTAALELLCHAAPGRTVAVLGDMRELGAAAAEAHRSVGKRAADLGVRIVVAVGEWAGELLQGASASSTPPAICHACPGTDEALRWVVGRCHDKDWILVKGSRAMAMERVVEGLRRAIGEAAAPAEEVQIEKCKLKNAN
jgi:UDP-N-acetylmuramoyl-tripeptide--D-alanyl-D-alanine ligase